jgi:hypothetical protein
MNAIITLWLSAFLLASCAAPHGDAPYKEHDVAEVIQYEHGSREEKEIFFPKDAEIMVYPLEEKIVFVEDNDEPIELKKSEDSYEIIYDRDGKRLPILPKRDPHMMRLGNKVHVLKVGEANQPY